MSMEYLSICLCHLQFLSSLVLFFTFFKNVYFWERETHRVWVREGREKGRHRIWSRLQDLSCQYRAWCRAQPHELWDHDLSPSQTLNQVSHPGAPLQCFIVFRVQVLLRYILPPFFTSFVIFIPRYFISFSVIVSGVVFFLLMFIYLFWERECQQGRVREREGEIETQAGSELSVQSWT